MNQNELNPSVAAPSSKVSDALGLVVWIAICFAAAAIGASFPVDDWYDNLNRPSIAPPNYLFGPVWTVLYVMMGVAAWLVWRQDSLRQTSLPLSIFLIQLALNAAWSWLFFGLHRMDLAFVDIVLLGLAILVTAILFYRLNRLAGCLLVPYLLWVCFATLLNFRFWQLNNG